MSTTNNRAGRTRGINNRSRFNNSPPQIRIRGGGSPRGAASGSAGGLRHQPYAPRDRTHFNAPTKNRTGVREVHFENVDRRSHTIRRRTGPRRGAGFRGGAGGDRPSGGVTRYFRNNNNRDTRDDNRTEATVSSQPAIGFDVGQDSLKVPEALGSFIPEEIKVFANDFLGQFYTIFDSNDRQPLLAAYHDQATFSYSVFKGGPGDQNSKRPFPQELLQDSRNLLRVTNSSARSKMLKQGKLNIVAALSSLPETSHVKESFTIDVPVCSPALLTFVANGLLTETKRNLVLAFCRNLTIIPQGEGWVITNDIWMIGNSTYEQRLRYPSCRTLDANMSSQETSRNNQSLANDIKVNRIMNRTKMNMSFSHQLLEEANFDLDAAIATFERLHAVGMIPPEAFG